MMTPIALVLGCDATLEGCEGATDTTKFDLGKEREECKAGGVLHTHTTARPNKFGFEPPRRQGQNIAIVPRTPTHVSVASPLAPRLFPWLLLEHACPDSRCSSKLRLGKLASLAPYRPAEDKQRYCRDPHHRTDTPRASHKAVSGATSRCCCPVAFAPSPGRLRRGISAPLLVVDFEGKPSRTS